jgi:ComEC/Rec2-related protein
MDTKAFFQTLLRKSPCLLPACVLGVAIFLFYPPLHQLNTNLIVSLEAGPTALRGKVISEPFVKIKGKRIQTSFRFRARFHEQEEIIYSMVLNPVGEILRGDELVLVGKLRKYYSKNKGSRNPIRFSFLGIGKRAHYLISEKQVTWSLASVKRFFQKRFSDLLPDPEAGVLQAMILGYRSNLNPQIRDQFQRLGIIHILSVSGFHMATAALAFFVIGRLCRLGGRGALCLSLVGAVLYFLMAGGRPPALRALYMIIFLLGGKLLGRKGNGINALSLAFILTVSLDPQSLFQLSFQLSYTVVFGILLSFELWKPQLGRNPKEPFWRRIMIFIKETVRIPLVAFIASFGLIAHIFGAPSPAVILVNVVLAPLFSLLISLGIVLCAGSLLGSFVGGICSLFCFLLTRFLLELVKWVADLTVFSLGSFQLSGAQMTAYYLVLLLGLGVMQIWKGRRHLSQVTSDSSG